MLYLGLVAAAVAGNVAANAAGIDAFRFLVATLILIVPALIGARLLYVASVWSLYGRRGVRVWDRNDGGAAQDGGIIAALVLSVPLFAALGLPLGPSWDAATFTMLVIPIFARVGCVLNGCCAGRPSRIWFSVMLPNHQGIWDRRIPSQGLEAAWAALLLVFAMIARRRLPVAGALFLLVTALYAAGRIVLLATRERPSPSYAPAIQRWVSASLILSSLAGLMARWPD